MWTGLQLSTGANANYWLIEDYKLGFQELGLIFYPPTAAFNPAFGADPLKCLPSPHPDATSKLVSKVQLWVKNGNDLFPADHACYQMIHALSYTYFDTTSVLHKCDVLFSSESNAFLIVHPEGYLQLFYEGDVSWTSCDEYGFDEDGNQLCHTKIADSTLQIDPTDFKLKLSVDLASPNWHKGYAQLTNPEAQGYELQVTNHGHLTFLSKSLTGLWTTKYHAMGGNGKVTWHLIMNQKCSADGDSWFTPETARQFGAASDALYSHLTVLTENKYQIDGAYIFKMTWPMNPGLYDIVWTQLTNPSANPIVEGFDVCHFHISSIFLQF